MFVDQQFKNIIYFDKQKCLSDCKFVVFAALPDSGKHTEIADIELVNVEKSQKLIWEGLDSSWQNPNTLSRNGVDANSSGA